MTFKQDCPICGARVGSWMRGCNNCKAGDRLVHLDLPPQQVCTYNIVDGTEPPV